MINKDFKTILKSNFLNVDVKKSFSFLNILEKWDHIPDKPNYLEMLKRNNDQVIEELSKKTGKALVKGEVQSGKTNNIIYIISTLIKNHGFNLIIFNSGKLNYLNKQNAVRISTSLKDGGLKIQSVIMDGTITYETIKDSIDKNDALIMSGIKDHKKINNLVRNINGEIKYKILVIDDEADDSTLTDKYWKQIKKLVRDGASYMMMTATPYKILVTLQIKWFDIYKVLENPKQYRGLEYFLENNRYEITDDLQDFEIFIKMLTHAYNTKKKFSLDSIKLLINTSIKTEDHKYTAEQINEDYMKKINLPNKYFPDVNWNRKHWEEFVENIVDNINVFNKNYKFKDGKEKDSIVIGGINLSRGITFTNLSAQWISIKNKSGKFTAHSIMQKSRWFGYHSTEPKIYMNSDLYKAYEECKKLEKITNRFKLGQNFSDLTKEEDFKYITIEGAKIEK